MALLMRTQLATQATNDFLTKDSYNEVMTMHGTTMIFLVVVPILAGFANFLVPLMIGARDMAFPRLNALSYWLFVFGGLVLMLSLLRQRAAPRKAGWTAYPPLSDAVAAGTARTSGSSACTSSPLSSLARRDQLRRHDPQHADAPG